LRKRVLKRERERENVCLRVSERREGEGVFKSERREGK
jgi:hypothetical protein